MSCGSARRSRSPCGSWHGRRTSGLPAPTSCPRCWPRPTSSSPRRAGRERSTPTRGRHLRTPDRGRRNGASIGRTREIWPCKDGYVSFGLRGGKARVPNLQTISRLVGDAVLTERDWEAYDHNTVSDEELRAIEGALG